MESCKETCSHDVVLPAEKKQRLIHSPEGPNLWSFSTTFPDPFVDGDYGSGASPYTLIELAMMAASGAIRSKTNWTEKMQNPTILGKWEEEAIQQGMTPAQIRYVLDELKYYATLKQGLIEPSAIDGVWKADGLIPNDLKDELRVAVSKLEAVPDFEKDWHPGTNNQVLNLVHPSLYCLVYGETKQTSETAVPPLEWIGSGEVILPPPEVKEEEAWGNYTKLTQLRMKKLYGSRKYQWLPSEFHVDTTGHVTIKSYINNLHPVWHDALYNIITKIFEKFVPLFNSVLEDLANPLPARVSADPFNWYEEDSNVHEDNEDSNTSEELNQSRVLKLPEPGKFQMPDLFNRVLVDLRGRDLQVVVKLSNIILTPDNPAYPGGTWHVEGMKNEQIVASAIYYYDCENITESRLHFRQAVQEPDYEQNDDRGVREVYGLVNEGPLNQQLGSVVTSEDRCIAFPNLFQHRVSPFELTDKTRPGHRKILVFFLVDPAVRVTSTLHVPPQQKAWLLPQLRSVDRFRDLPEEILQKIVDFLPWPMSLEQAKAHRLELMKERKYFLEVNNENFFERNFSLCEH